MAGEMFDSDVTEENFPVHFAIARELNGQVKPFDVYQGPYVVIGADLRVGSGPYAYAPSHLGIVRLWICSDDGYEAFVYNEANEKQSEPFPYYTSVSCEMAIDAARSVI